MAFRIFVTLIILALLVLAASWLVYGSAQVSEQQRYEEMQDSDAAPVAKNNNSSENAETKKSVLEVGDKKGNTVTKPKLTAYEAATADSNNPRVQSVLEAARTGKYPERLSVDVDPKPFDAKDFAENPQAYLEIVEPGRVYQTLPPVKDAPRLSLIGKSPIVVASSADVTIKVKALPGVPVSFYASNGGIFRESTLNSITVQADKDGVASVTYFANPGTFGIAPVIVGSPLLAGNEEIMMSVRSENDIEYTSINPVEK